MSEELIPQVRNTNTLLGRLEAVVIDIRESLKGHTRDLRTSTEQIRDSITSQTETLGEIEIIIRVAEMQAIAALLDEEETHVALEAESDSNAMTELDRYFRETSERLSGIRNKRVRELLQPLFNVMENDLERHIEARTAAVDGLLDRSLSVTRDLVQDRASTLGTLVDRIASIVKKIADARQNVRRSIQHLRTPRTALAEGKPAAYGVPFYVVEVENEDGSNTVHVIPPSQIVDHPDAPLGIALRAIPGFDRITTSIATKWTSLKPGGTASRSTSVLQSAQQLHDAALINILPFSAAAADRHIDYYDEGGPVLTLPHAAPARQAEHAVARTVAPPDAPKLPVKDGTAPKKQAANAEERFDEAVRLMDQKKYRRALVVLLELQAAGSTNPMIPLYIDLCRVEAAE